MTLRTTLRLVATSAVILASGLLQAADLSGHWTSQFESPIGAQKYTYDFKTTGTKTTGKATYDHSMGKGEAVLSDITLEGSDVSFTETVNIQGAPLVITYKGQINGDQMTLTRVVGDYGTEEIVAKRAPAAPASEKK